MNPIKQGSILSMQSLGTMTVKLDEPFPLPPNAQFTLAVEAGDDETELFDVEVIRQQAHKIYSVRITY